MTPGKRHAYACFPISTEATVPSAANARSCWRSNEGYFWLSSMTIAARDPGQRRVRVDRIAVRLDDVHRRSARRRRRGLGTLRGDQLDRAFDVDHPRRLVVVRAAGRRAGQLERLVDTGAGRRVVRGARLRLGQDDRRDPRALLGLDRRVDRVLVDVGDPDNALDRAVERDGVEDDPGRLVDEHQAAARADDEGIALVRVGELGHAGQARAGELRDPDRVVDHDVAAILARHRRRPPGAPPRGCRRSVSETAARSARRRSPTGSGRGRAARPPGGRDRARSCRASGSRRCSFRRRDSRRCRRTRRQPRRPRAPWPRASGSAGRTPESRRRSRSTADRPRRRRRPGRRHGAAR